MKRMMLVFGALLGCQDLPDPTSDVVRKPVESPTYTAPESPKTETRTTFSTRVRERLDQLNRKIAELEARADKRAKEEAPRLRAKRDELSKKLDTMGDQAESRWQAFKVDAKKWLDDLDHDIDRALKKK